MIDRRMVIIQRIKDYGLSTRYICMCANGETKIIGSDSELLKARDQIINYRIDQVGNDIKFIPIRWYGIKSTVAIDKLLDGESLEITTVCSMYKNEEAICETVYEVEGSSGNKYTTDSRNSDGIEIITADKLLEIVKRRISRDKKLLHKLTLDISELEQLEKNLSKEGVSK